MPLDTAYTTPANNDRQQRHYDYIIAGAGCAGLSLAVRIAQSTRLQDKSVLIVDKDPKRSNDRTWCFWEKEEGLFEEIVFHEWKQLQLHTNTAHIDLDIAPMSYKMIRGIDFYEYCFSVLGSRHNFTIITAPVQSIFTTADTRGIVVNNQQYSCDHLFNSILFETPVLKKKTDWLLQHFRGWIIETPTACFDPSSAILMDFRTSQKHGAAFCYVLPFSSTKALVEYTLFSPKLLADPEYNQGLSTYIADVLGIAGYNIIDIETGSIPMTDHFFPPGKDGVVNIGTAGGLTKGSSGYTFQFIQRHSGAMVTALECDRSPITRISAKRFRFYDSVLLRVLSEQKLPADDIFQTLFQKNPASLVLKFLDNQTTPVEELRIISTLPTLPFMRAAIQKLF